MTPELSEKLTTEVGARPLLLLPLALHCEEGHQSPLLAGGSHQQVLQTWRINVVERNDWSVCVAFLGDVLVVVDPCGVVRGSRDPWAAILPVGVQHPDCGELLDDGELPLGDVFDTSGGGDHRVALLHGVGVLVCVGGVLVRGVIIVVIIKEQFLVVGRR